MITSADEEEQVGNFGSQLTILTFLKILQKQFGAAFDQLFESLAYELTHWYYKSFQEFKVRLSSDKLKLLESDPELLKQFTD